MTPRKDIKDRDRQIGKIMDALFDAGMRLPKSLHTDLMLWLLDERDADLKEKHMRRKFDEVMESPDIGMPLQKKPGPIRNGAK